MFKHSSSPPRALFGALLTTALLFSVGCPDAEEDEMPSPDMSTSTADMGGNTPDLAENEGDLGGDSGLSPDMQADLGGGALDMDTDQGLDMVPTGEAPEVAGQWASIYGEETISAQVWGWAKLVSFDDAKNEAVTQNSADDMYNPNKFNKIVWTDFEADHSFYYCTVDYGLESEAEALASDKVADDSAPEDSGCGGFPWTRLVPNEVIEIAGTYSSSFDMPGMPAGEQIMGNMWDSAYLKMTITRFNNAKNEAVTQNSADDMYNPNKFNKIVWTEPQGDGSFYYCTVDYGLESEEAALASDKVADDSTPDASGCGGFPWTKLMVAQ